MKITLLSVLLVVLHYHGAFSMMKHKHTEEEVDLKQELQDVVINVKNTLVGKKKITLGKQFGFLLLGNEDAKYFDELELKTDGFLIFDNERPEINLCDNFLAATPYQDFTQVSSSGEKGKWVHTEDSLLGELDGLYHQYSKRRNRTPSFVLLYSYLMPCDGCTGKIITKKNSKLGKRLHWFVAYTIGHSDKISYVNENNTAKNKLAMEKKGIRVLQIPF